MTVTRKICECAPLADWEQGTITAQRLVLSKKCDDDDNDDNDDDDDDDDNDDDDADADADDA